MQVMQQPNDHLFPIIGERPINQVKRKKIARAITDLWIIPKRHGHVR